MRLKVFQAFMSEVEISYWRAALQRGNFASIFPTHPKSPGLDENSLYLN